MAAAIARRSARRRISVTDLVNPRQTFFSRTRPDIVISADRKQLMMAGTGFHDLFGRAVSTEEYVEQFVEFEEIVGKIDVFESEPIELKTTSSIPTEVLTSRPGQVEQLAMYCAMVARPLGHLLYYRRSEYGREPLLKAFDVEMTDRDHIVREMLQRRDLLRAALDTGDPCHLLRCEWFGRDCTYADVCGCVTAQPLTRMVSTGTVRIAENTALAEVLKAKILAVPPIGPADNFTLNDLVFPRKAALRRDGIPESGEPDAGEQMESMERRGFLDVLEDAVWHGVPGACRTTRVQFGPIRGSLLLYRGIPTLLRATKRREMIPRDRLAVDAPYYTDRLAFECAMAGSEKGRLIIYYSALEDKFMVYDFWFRDLEGIRAEMRRRLDLLQSGAQPNELPPCEPAWMSRLCNFGHKCACAGVPRR
ncbi:MAG TPA: hypothetical protein VKV57_12055 [bacterium]|nr:hypothetical protein [bacterium]